MDDVSAAIDRAFTAAGAQTKDLTSALTQAKAIVDEEAVQVGELSSALDAQIALARELAGKAEAGSALAGALNRVVGDLESVKARVEGLSTELSELSGTLEKTAGDLAQGATDASAAHEELDGLVSDAAGGLSALRGTATQNAISSLDALAAEIHIQYRRNVIRPRHLDRAPDMKHHDRVRLNSSGLCISRKNGVLPA